MSKKNTKNLDKRVLKEMKNQLKECTFTPTTNESRSPRVFEAFLRDQKVKQQNKENKIKEKLREKEEAENASLSPVPSICKVFYAEM